MSDVERAISQALYEVKHKIHDRAVDPRIRGVDPYVSLKAVDAIIDRNIKKYYDEAVAAESDKRFGDVKNA